MEVEGDDLHEGIQFRQPLRVQANHSVYPYVALLLICGTLSASNATVVRSFSKLKLIKTDLCRMMKEDRLSGFALLFVHRHIVVGKVMDLFSRTGKRPVTL